MKGILLSEIVNFNAKSFHEALCYCGYTAVTLHFNSFFCCMPIQQPIHQLQSTIQLTQIRQKQKQRFN